MNIGFLQSPAVVFPAVIALAALVYVWYGVKIGRRECRLGYRPLIGAWMVSAGLMGLCLARWLL